MRQRRPLHRCLTAPKRSHVRILGTVHSTGATRLSIKPPFERICAGAPDHIDERQTLSPSRPRPFSNSSSAVRGVATPSLRPSPRPPPLCCSPPGPRGPAAAMPPKGASKNKQPEEVLTRIAIVSGDRCGGRAGGGRQAGARLSAVPGSHSAHTVLNYTGASPRSAGRSARRAARSSKSVSGNDGCACIARRAAACRTAPAAAAHPSASPRRRAEPCLLQPHRQAVH